MLCGAAIWVLLLLGRNHWLVAVEAEAEALLGLEGGMTVFGDTRAHVNLQGWRLQSGLGQTFEVLCIHMPYRSCDSVFACSLDTDTLSNHSTL